MLPRGGRPPGSRAQLCLRALLGGQQPIPVAGQRPQLGQQRAAGWQWPPVGVLVAQGVGQHEGVEDVVFAAGGPIALPGPGRDPRRDRVDHMPSGLQVLNQQPLGPLDRDRQPGPKPTELLVEPSQAGDVMGQADLAPPSPGRVHDADLMMTAAPVDPDEHRLPAGAQQALHERPPSPALPPHRRARLDAHLGARGTTPTGQFQARHHREGRVCTPDLEGHAAKVLPRR